MVEIYGEACPHRIGTLAGLWLTDATNRSLEKAAGCGWIARSVTDDRYALGGSLENEPAALIVREGFVHLVGETDIPKVLKGIASPQNQE